MTTLDAGGETICWMSQTWKYTASHTVTQAELDAGTAIVNMATVTGTGAAPDTTTPRLRLRRARSCTS